MTLPRSAIGSLGEWGQERGVWDLAIFALVLSTFSRLLVAFLGVPPAVNFLHFPLVAGLFLFSLRRIQRVAVPIYAGCGLLFLVYLGSASINSAGAVNTIIGYLLLAEPFLLFAVLINSERDAASSRRLGWWLVAFALVQIPIAVGQAPRALSTRDFDLVQGTFTGMVAGHHILGGVAMVGALHLLRWPDSLSAWLRWPLGMMLFAVVVLSDTKQVMLAVLIGYAVLLAARVRSAKQAARLAARISLAVAGVYAAQWIVGTQGYFYQLGNVVTWFAGKFVVFPILVGHFHSIANWMVGVGPGHGVTRIGGWLLEKYWGILAPLGATRTEIAADVWSMSGPPGARSSLFAPLFSWAGIFGDVGVAGVVVYGGLLWIVFRRFCVDDACRLIVLSIVCLGFLFEWLEEPNFMLYALAVIGQRWTDESSRTNALPQLPRVAWLLPGGGVHWYPALIELSRHFPQLRVFTAKEAFARELQPHVEVEVVGRLRVVGEDPIAAGYRARLTLVSPRVIWHLYRFRPAVVFTNSFGIWTGVATLLKRLGGWRIIVAYEGSSPGVDFRDSRLRMAFRRFLVRSADACITNTQVGRRYLITMLGVRSELVFTRPYLVPMKELLDLNAKRAEPTPASIQPPRFLYVGKLTGRKGVDLLLRACTRLEARNCEYSLDIVGDGPLRQQLESLATSLGLSRIRWVGRVPYGEVGGYLQAADVLILPTWEDTWGMTVPESLLAGKAVLCSVRAGSSELVEDGGNGYLFDPADPEMLAERMGRFIDRPALSREMGERSRQIIAEHTPAAVGDFLARVTRSVLYGAS